MFSHSEQNNPNPASLTPSSDLSDPTPTSIEANPPRKLSYKEATEDTSNNIQGSVDSPMDFEKLGSADPGVGEKHIHLSEEAKQQLYCPWKRSVIIKCVGRRLNHQLGHTSKGYSFTHTVREDNLNNANAGTTEHNHSKKMVSEWNTVSFAKRGKFLDPSQFPISSAEPQTGSYQNSGKDQGPSIMDHTNSLDCPNTYHSPNAWAKANANTPSSSKNTSIWAKTNADTSFSFSKVQPAKAHQNYLPTTSSKNSNSRKSKLGPTNRFEALREVENPKSQSYMTTDGLLNQENTPPKLTAPSVSLDCISSKNTLHNHYPPLEKSHATSISLHKNPLSTNVSFPENPSSQYEQPPSLNSNLQTSLPRSCPNLVVGNGTPGHVNYSPRNSERETNSSGDPKSTVPCTPSKGSPKPQSSQL
ncbi:hypothetical protein FXO38_27931 [Capsicum annuum]|nr:hypothetical protein FXO38_27931 [Capsicum annuum]